MFRLCTDVCAPACLAASCLLLVYARRETRKVKGANRNAAFCLATHHGADLQADRSQHRQQNRCAKRYDLCVVGHLAAPLKETAAAKKLRLELGLRGHGSSPRSIASQRKHGFVGSLGPVEIKNRPCGMSGLHGRDF
jgi:hypothetical protein